MNIVIIGATGGIGSALTELFSDDTSNKVFALARRKPENMLPDVEHISIDFDDESSLEEAASACAAAGEIDIVVNTVGILHGNGIQPEKSLRDVSPQAFAAYQFANCTCAALALKHFSPGLARKRRTVFASLSARIGSISDNRLGGWYGYRISKAAHNMLIKTASIELSRTHKLAAVVGIHPGTVDTGLSKPFTSRLPSSQIFTAAHAANRIQQVIFRVNAEDTGKVFAHDGNEIPA